VVIRASSSREVQRLLHDLESPDAVAREAAIARLRVLGSRALPKLELLIRTGTDGQRTLGLRALDGLDDPRVVDIALVALDDRTDAVRAAAVAALRPWLAREDDTRVMDALVRCALAEDERPEIRNAARDALAQLPPDIVEPVLAGGETRGADAPQPRDPASAAAWLATHGDGPLSALHTLVTRLREAERLESDDERRRDLQMARGAVHARLARRGSAVALYDLRETFAGATEPLPVDYLSAAAAIGDGDLIDAMGAAWAASPPSEAWWREHLAAAAAAIAARVKLTRRHAAMKRLQARWPGFLR
jgi:hypothetical protein